MIDRTFARRSGLRACLCAGILLAAACIPSANRFIDWEPESIFAYAEEKYAEEDWANAIAAYDAIVTRHPTFPQTADARMQLARAMFAEEQYIAAASEFQRFLDRFPRHPSSPEAALGVCQSYAELSPVPERDQGFTEQAVQNCENVVFQYSGTPESGVASRIRDEMVDKLAEKRFLQAQHYFDREAFDSANLTFQSVADEFPSSTWAPRALLAWYDSLLLLEYEDEALEVFGRLTRFYPNSDEADIARRRADGGASGG